MGSILSPSERLQKAVDREISPFNYVKHPEKLEITIILIKNNHLILFVSEEGPGGETSLRYPEENTDERRFFLQDIRQFITLKIFTLLFHSEIKVPISSPKIHFQIHTSVQPW